MDFSIILTMSVNTYTDVCMSVRPARMEDTQVYPVVILGQLNIN